MVSAFDTRIVQVSIQFEDGIQTFQGLSIYATGQKFLAATQNQCEFKIFNLTKEQRNYILTRTSPYQLQRQPIRMFLDVGRESYGTFRLFDGFVWTSNITQPPDIGIILTAITNNFATGVILSNTQSSVTQLRVVAQTIADNNGLKLDFQATDRQIDNYAYNGSAGFQINSLNEIGGIIASVDQGTLTVINAGQPLSGGARVLSAATGMVGIPQITQKGIVVKMMLDNTIQLNKLVSVESEVLPAANGDYIVEKIVFEVASRDQPFFYTLDCRIPAYYSGTIS